MHKLTSWIAMPSPDKERTMTRLDWLSDFQNSYEYHGNTTIEVIKKQNGITIERDWLLFDSVEEAQDFFNAEGY